MYKCVLQQGGRVMRFFVTPIMARDVADIDITIPLLVGLKYALQKSRTIDIDFEMSANTHTTPFATKVTHPSHA